MRSTWELKFGAVLILLSISIFEIKLKFLTIGKPETTYDYILSELGFLPINILLVTLILEQLLIARSKKEKMEKLSMVIGAFFSEVGTRLLVYFSDFDPDIQKISGHLIVTNDWSNEEFEEVRKQLLQYDYIVDIKKVEFLALKEFLKQHRSFMVRLFENPILLEHTTFTDLLTAIFHLTEELESRDSFIDLPDTDYAHLAGDSHRAYAILVLQWFDYMIYLKKNYPYLFSLAIRKNPFDKNASPIVR